MQDELARKEALNREPTPATEMPRLVPLRSPLMSVVKQSDRDVAQRDVAPTAPAQVRLVQHQEEFELPLPNLGRAGLLDLNSPHQAESVAAPAPDDLLRLSPEPATRKDQFLFKDQTPQLRPTPAGTAHRQAPEQATEEGDRSSRPTAQDSIGRFTTRQVQADGEIDFSLPIDPELEPSAEPTINDTRNGSEAFGAPNEGLDSSLSQDLESLDTLPPIFDSEPESDQLPPMQTDRPDDNPLSIFGNDEEPDVDGAESIDLSSTRGRDCEAQDESCRLDFAYLARRERTNMSLDITPSIRPSEVDMAVVEQTRLEKLADVPSRTWTDMSGRVIADGRFEDYRDGKVFVRTLNESLRPIQYHQLSNADRCFVAAWWELPDECNFESEQYAMRDFRLTSFTWAAAATCHKPLYFEQVAVERYGHSAGPVTQPILSGAHFFGSIVMLPYKAGLNPPNECLYTLGHYRPGDCAPWLVPGFPMSTRGFRWEGLALGAGIALLP